jgi:hypothetical protein
LLASLFVMGLSARIVQVASTLAGTHGPVAARGEGSASAVLTASRQVGSALGVAVVSATLVAVHGDASHRTAVAMLVATAFAIVGLLATRVIPRGPGPLLLRLDAPGWLAEITAARLTTGNFLGRPQLVLSDFSGTMG